MQLANMSGSSSLVGGGAGAGGLGDEASGAAEWMRLYNTLEGAMAEAQNDFNDAQQRGIGNRQKRSINKKLTESFDNIARLERNLANMERNPMRFKIGEGEVNRRKGMLAAMRAQAERLEADVQSGGRASLMGGARRVNLAEESHESQQMSNVQIHAQQRAALSAQDEKLDGILDGVSRLKVMSSDINAELDLHVNLLGELDSAVDSTDARLQRNIKRIEIVQEKSGGCCGLIIMLVLFVLIIILLVTNWACHIFNSKKC